MKSKIIIGLCLFMSFSFLLLSVDVRFDKDTHKKLIGTWKGGTATIVYVKFTSEPQGGYKPSPGFYKYYRWRAGRQNDKDHGSYTILKDFDTGKTYCVIDWNNMESAIRIVVKIIKKGSGDDNFALMEFIGSKKLRLTQYGGRGRFKSVTELIRVRN